MEKSENFGFNLPSRDSEDVVDVNQLSDNFRIIDKELYKVSNLGGLSTDTKSTLRTFFVNIQTLLTQIAYITENNLGNTVIQNAIDVVTALDNEPVIPDEPIDPESEVTQNGSVLTIVSGVTVIQNNSILSIA